MFYMQHPNMTKSDTKYVLQMALIVNTNKSAKTPNYFYMRH